MATNPLYYDSSMNALAALFNSGFIKVYTGSQPSLNGSLTGTLQVTMTFGSTAFGSSSSAVITANTITGANAVATGTAGYYAFVKSDGTTVIGTGTVGTSGADMNFSTTSFVSGAPVSITSGTITG